MPLLRLVSLLCGLLLPFQGMAQSNTPPPLLGPVSPPPMIPAPGAPDEGEATKPAEGEPQGEIIPPEERLRSGDSGSPAVRIPVSILLGTVGGAVGAIPGAIIMADGFCWDCEVGDFYVGFALSVAGAVVGMSLTIDWVGDWLGGQGDFWPTVLGVVLGVLVGTAGAFAAVSISEAAPIIPAVLGPPLGGVLAYEISSAMARREAMAAMAPRPRVAPLLTVSPRGGLIGGLAGTF
jgi:hypothetical protein